jgi:hypothetical protein
MQVKTELTTYPINRNTIHWSLNSPVPHRAVSEQIVILGPGGFDEKENSPSSLRTIHWQFPRIGQVTVAEAIRNQYMACIHLCLTSEWLWLFRSNFKPEYSKERSEPELNSRARTFRWLQNGHISCQSWVVSWMDLLIGLVRYMERIFGCHVQKRLQIVG